VFQHEISQESIFPVENFLDLELPRNQFRGG